MATALDVGRFLAREFIDLDNPATNLKIQKLLYFAWIGYYKENVRSDDPYLFRDTIMAWKLGPVVPEVYREFSIFSAMPITFADNPSDMSEKEKTFLKRFAKDNISMTASGLVYKSHKDGSPWKRTYKPNVLNNPIPFSLIIELECR